MVNMKKGCEPATSELYKQSDVKDFGADAKIIIALLRQQPQKRVELSKNAGINESTFSRYKRLLINKNILKEGDKGFSLWNFKEVPSLWDSLVENMKNAGAHLTKLQIEKLRLGDDDKITGIPEMLYDKVISAEGIIILKGATKLEAVLRLHIPHDYLAFFASQFPVNPGDRVKWKDGTYFVNDVESFFEGEIFNYSIAKLAYSLSLK